MTKNKQLKANNSIGMFEIVPHEEYLGQFRIRYPDGVLSADFYNYSRARDHASSLAVTYRKKPKVDPKQDGVQIV